LIENLTKLFPERVIVIDDKHHGHGSLRSRRTRQGKATKYLYPCRFVTENSGEPPIPDTLRAAAVCCNANNKELRPAK